MRSVLGGLRVPARSGSPRNRRDMNAGGFAIAGRNVAPDRGLGPAESVSKGGGQREDHSAPNSQEAGPADCLAEGLGLRYSAGPFCTAADDRMGSPSAGYRFRLRKERGACVIP